MSAETSHENTITSEAVYSGSYLGRSEVDQLVLGRGFMLFWTSLICGVMYSIDISIKVQLTALRKIFQLPFSRWQDWGASKRNKIQHPEQRSLNLAWKDEVRNGIKSWMSREFRCPGSTTQHCTFFNKRKENSLFSSETHQEESSSLAVP